MAVVNINLPYPVTFQGIAGGAYPEIGPFYLLLCGHNAYIL
jgi:hypothetical protein